MVYEEILNRKIDPSNLNNINSKYRENTKSLSNQIKLLIEISETISKILELFETE
jgi:hypothetical protein